MSLIPKAFTYTCGGCSKNLTGRMLLIPVVGMSKG